MACAAHDDKSGNSADGAGQGHGPHDHLLHIDARVPRRVLALAHHGNLVTLLAVFQIDKHSQGQRQDNDQIPPVIQAEELRNPSASGGGIDGSHGIGTLGIFPENNADCNHLHSHIVHHKGKKSLVCIPVGLEKCGNQPPDHGRQGAHHKHQGKQDDSRKGISQVNHHSR